jgi:hypothetical protein
MGDISKDFNASEFACKSRCGLKYPAPALFRTLQALRETVDKPILIVSGWRCAKHNKDEGSKLLGKQGFGRGQVGDATASAHTRGEAADIRVAGMSKLQLYELLIEMHGRKEIPELEYAYMIHASSANVHIGVDQKARNGRFGGEQ